MIKKTVVAGSFYPDDPNILQQMLQGFFTQAEKDSVAPPPDKKLYTIISPHAGYIYSGQSAAYIYMVASHYSYTKAVIISPSHRCQHLDFFVGDYEAYETPLGAIKTCRDSINHLLSKPDCRFDDFVDTREHSLEVQLPFLKFIFPEILIVPIIFCRQSIDNAAKLMSYIHEILDPQTLIVISTDLSHFHDALTAEKIDSLLIDSLKKNEYISLNDHLIKRKCEACGFGGILTAMMLSEKFPATQMDCFRYTHSGMACGDNKSVVGYLSCGYFK
jgi:hypothetical protein